MDCCLMYFQFMSLLKFSKSSHEGIGTPERWRSLISLWHPGGDQTVRLFGPWRLLQK